MINAPMFRTPAAVAVVLAALAAVILWTAGGLHAEAPTDPAGTHLQDAPEVPDDPAPDQDEPAEPDDQDPDDGADQDGDDGSDDGDGDDDADGDDDGTDDTDEGAEPEPEPEPMLPRFEFRNGDTTRGDVDLQEITVRTTYGDLHIPLDDVAEIRFGRLADPELIPRIEAEIERLGSEDAQERKAARSALEAIGREALPELERTAKDEDAGASQRLAASELVEQLQSSVAAMEAEPVHDLDRVVTPGFTVVGRVQLETLVIHTKWGDLEVHVKDLRRVRGRRLPNTEVTLQLPGENNQGDMLRTSITVERGQTVKVRCSGTVNFVPWGRNSGPEGNGQMGTHTLNTTNGRVNVATGTVVARCGNSNAIVVVGEDKVFKADQSGPLFLGVVGPGGSGNTTGSYDVRVIVSPE